MPPHRPAHQHHPPHHHDLVPPKAMRTLLAPLEAVAPKNSPGLAALVDCLVDGPPHHALANAALVCALGTVLERFPLKDNP